MASLVTAGRSILLSLPEVTCLSALRRSTTLFTQGKTADALYIIDEGMVKLTRTNPSGGRIILAIFGPGHVVGEETLRDVSTVYGSEAEILTTAAVLRVPRETLIGTLSTNLELWSALTTTIIQQKGKLAEKVELLCLHDVEYRILHYLGELSSLVQPSIDGEGYQLPITQLELADLIGATRETTSTTLNQLERRGLVRLSRRLLTVPSPSTLKTAAAARKEQPTGVGVSAPS